MSDRAPDVIIVGGGIAGCAAALRAAQYHMKTAWFLGDQDTERRSRGRWVANIDNMIGVHEGIVKKKMLKLLREDAHAPARERIEREPHGHISTRDIIDNTIGRVRSGYGEHVELIEVAADAATRDPQGFTVSGAGVSRTAPAMVLATGVMDRQPSIKRARGEEVIDEPKWIYPFANRETVLYCIRCEGHLTAGTEACVIGSRGPAAELAMALHERYGSVCHVVTNGEPPAWSEEDQRILEAYGIEVITARIVDITGQKGKLHTIAFEDGTSIDVDFALVSMGLYRVYNELARALGAELTDPDQPIEERHVAIDQRGETSVRGLFAIGDMTRHRDGRVMKQVYTSQEYAVRAVDVIDRRRRIRMRERALAGEG